jgi:NADPH:quinone reductase-like Zn-dependent oxidoreductase
VTVLSDGHRNRAPRQNRAHIGSGDVSPIAVQLANLMGCRAIATTSGAAKAEKPRLLGAGEGGK